MPHTPIVPTEDPCASALPERTVGIAPGSEWKRDPRAADDMTEMADIGVRWIRLGFEWAVIEPRPGVYRWDSVDRIMEEAAASCLSVLAMVGTAWVVGISYWTLVSYRRHRFPPELIQHAVWLYLRFTLSYRDVEELLA